MASQKFKPNEFVVGKHSSDSLLNLAASGRLSLLYGTEVQHSKKRKCTMKISDPHKRFRSFPAVLEKKKENVSACRNTLVCA